MPKKHVPQKDTPELFAKVFKVINGVKDKRSYITVHRIAKEIHAKLEQMGLKPNSRNVLIQVRRALKFGVQKNLFLYKGGKYRLAITEAAASSKTSKKSVVPLDSLELLKSRKTKRKPKAAAVKKRRCTRTREEHSSSCRKRQKKHPTKPNKRYLSRKCKSRYYQSNNKSGKTSSNSNSRRLGVSTAEETTNAENTKSESCEFTENVIPPKSSTDIQHWDNKQEAIDKSKYGKQSRKSRIQQRSSSSYNGTATNSEEPKSRRNKKRKVKNLKEIENLSSDNTISGLSTSTAIAAAIMIMMSLWYGYR